MHIPTPPSQQFQSLPHKIRRVYPRLACLCQTRVTPAAGWIANVSSQVGGNAPGRARKRQRGLTGEAMANAVPLAGGALSRVPCKASHRAGVPFLPAASGRGAGQRCGPVADMARVARQGPCRNTRPKQLPRSVRTAAGATRAEGPEEGQVRKPAPCVCEADACRMGTPSGEFRAARCQRHPILFVT